MPKYTEEQLSLINTVMNMTGETEDAAIKALRESEWDASDAVILLAGLKKDERPREIYTAPEAIRKVREIPIDMSRIHAGLGKNSGGK